MTRLSFRCWLIPLLLGPACALALEVGEIQVQSALNQLFDATIPLPTLTPEELSRVSVKIASPPMFEEFGLDRTPALNHLVFSIQYDAEGRVYVKVVSTQPIREPSLALLLEFGWPRGKTFREFTVLLDPVRRLAQRPGSRTKTVLNTPDAPGATPASIPAPAVAAAVPENREPAASPLPVATPSTTPAYKPGDVYGPVTPGEGLWGIALKLRPEGITREQMMQALFQANPQAFSSAGIAGLKTGSKLRIPTYREIADSTGSPIAQRLAALEEHPATPAIADGAPPPGAPEVFPLAPSTIPEPTVVTETPAPQPTVPTQLPQTPEPPVAAQSEQPSTPEPQPPQVPEPPVATPEKTPVSASDSPILEPVSATPLLFIAVSEILAGAVQLPMIVTSEQTASRPSAAEPPVPVADEKPAEPPVPVIAEEPPVSASDSPILEPVSATPLLFIVVSEILADAARLPTIIIPEPAATEPPAAEPLAVTAEEKPVESPAAAGEKPAEPPAPVAAEEKPAEPPAVAETPDKVYKGGDEYGPVSNNERLWDIATKVRPDPNLGRDIMMKALFLANPQAFSKPTMDHLKAGSMLRIPNLQEIVKHTDSTVAKSLLKQQNAAEPRNADLPKPASPDGGD